MSTDTLLDRIRLRNHLKRWRAIAILLAVILGVVLIKPEELPLNVGDFIARVRVDGFIGNDPTRTEILRNIAKNDQIKALIVHIDSPGGTVVGGETLYDTLRRINSVKPVVVVMNTLATSAGYMAAVGAEYIVAHKGTLTGSIGVLMHVPDVQELADKVGIDVEVIKSGPLKGTPSPFEDTSPEARGMIHDVLQDYYEVFVEMVAEGRSMSVEQVRELADGRVFTGRQALEYGLVDEVGGEANAFRWLVKNKKISSLLKVKDVKLHKKIKGFQKFMSFLGFNPEFQEMFYRHGLLSLWQGNAVN